MRVTQLSGGFRLLVGRDLEERARMGAIITTAARGSVALVVVLGLAGGFFVTRRVLRRFDAMTETTQRIMAGDLSGRLPVTGIGDELDRLATNLNDMLERIEALMRGLKEVSDNIAHDLKTPLTRLRNRCEAALRTAKSEAEYRAALESMLDESDGLIRTFDALLMIARAESGQARDNMIEFEAAEIVRGVGELYEPVAEEKGLTLDGRRAEPATDQGQSRTAEPGARQSGRQRDQIRAPGRRRGRAAGEIDARRRGQEGDRVRITRGGSRPRASRRPIGRAWSSGSSGCRRAWRSRARASA